MSFFSDLFGTIASGFISRSTHTKQFIPTDAQGGTLNFQDQTAEWMGLRNPLMQKYAYDFCFPVSSVVDKLADMDVDGYVVINNIKGKGKDKEATGDYAGRIKKLLKKPNPFQSWEEFRGQQVVYKKVFGYCPVLPLVPAAMDNSYTLQMINIPPWIFGVRLKEQQKALWVDKEDVIDKYLVTLPGAIVELTPDKIILLTDGYVYDHTGVLPQSKLVGLDMAVSNICRAMEADNVLLRKKGPLGFISHDAAAVKDSVAGYVPMTKKERLEIQESLQAYGLTLNQYQYVISRQAVKWNPISFDVRQLATKETIIQCEKAVCHRYSYPYVLYEETESTFANGDNAAASVYQTNIIPNSLKDFGKYNSFFKSIENGIEITVDFSHVAALQEDVKMANESQKLKTESLLLEFMNNVITLNEFRALMGREVTADGDVYYKDMQSRTTNPVLEDDEDPTSEN